jgi:hypothetical protein
MKITGLLIGRIFKTLIKFAIFTLVAWLVWRPLDPPLPRTQALFVKNARMTSLHEVL